MPESVLPTHESLLRLCAAGVPAPWHPKAFVRDNDVPRAAVDGLLNDLRLAGLVQLTEWQKGQGQGYLPTDLGKEVLNDPTALGSLRSGVSIPKTRKPEPDAEATGGTPTTYERGEAARKAILEPGTVRLVPLLILVNVMVFIVGIYLTIQNDQSILNYLGMNSHFTVLHRLGALGPADIVRGEWWRLVTCCFVHIGLVHLILNMYSLYVLRFLESLWGSARYLLIYVSSGIGGSCAAMLMASPSLDNQMLLAGASGAIWGIMASEVAWLYMNWSHLPPRERAARMQSLFVVFALNVGISFMPRVSSAAHFGGGIVGFIMATLLHVQRFASPPRRTAATVLTVLLPMLCVAALFEKVRTDDRWRLFADHINARQGESTLRDFRRDVLPSIDQAELAADRVEKIAVPLIDIAPDKRPDDARMKNIQEELANAHRKVTTAQKRLPESPYPEQGIEEARKRGQEYLKDLQSQIDRFKQLLDEGGTWTPDEQKKLTDTVNKSRLAWQSSRKQF